MIKIKRLSRTLEVSAVVGIDLESDGLKLAARLGIACTAKGIDGLLEMPEFKDIRIVFDATSAAAHQRHSSILISRGKRVIDLTPAAIGPFTIPSVSGEANLESPNVNMVTCGGQATIPMVAAVSRITRVRYAEIVASIASKSAGPGTRANIDEFTETTTRAIVELGCAERGKAIIVLNPAEPPLIMRDTVYCLSEEADERKVTESIHAMVKEVQAYVPGYRLKQAVQFERLDSARALPTFERGNADSLMKITIFLEVEGAAHYLPAYAGNLDIMTSAALRTGEHIAAHIVSRIAA
jgi:acetaldehyde dehydrogenase